MPGTRRTGRMGWLLLALALVAGGFTVLMRPWESSAEALAQRPGFAEDRADAQAAQFDKERAMGYLKQICDLGPRISGTPELTKLQELLRKHFEAHGAKVELQEFNAQQRSQAKPVKMANLIARWHPERPRRIILCAHYDTRPIADQEEDIRNHRKPFLAANDGASGPALMMELAQRMKNLETKVGVDFVLFDGEEYIFDNRPDDQGGDLYFFGSEHFAKEYTQSRRDPKSPVYVAGVLVDLFAGKNAQFPVEQYSHTMAGHVVEEIWKIAAEVKATAFVNKWGTAVRDDHLALNKARIPTIDIIDFGYDHWHRLSDVPANCSGDSMEQVARVVVVWMQRAK